MKEKRTKYDLITKYPNIIGSAILTALSVVQLGMFVLWLSKNLVTNDEGFAFKGTIALVLCATTVFMLTKIIVEKVVKNTKLTWPYITVLTVYIMTLPTAVSVCFNAVLYAVCFTLTMILSGAIILYFYGKHEKRLVVLIVMFAVLCALGFLNRAAFWTGITESFIFLSIQLYRNLRTKRKNIADKSWRNTLLLFCILIIIMLLPQYFKYNDVQATLYTKSVREQVAARAVVPYLENEMMESDEKYLLGVINRDDYDPGHGYESFNFLMHRYEQDGLDMEEIWNNLYSNAYHRYGKQIFARYAKNTVKGWAAPLLVQSEMSNELIDTHHGYYYGLFQDAAPVIADKYMAFGLLGLKAIFIILAIQLMASVIIDIAKGRFKKKLEEGEHRKIEALAMLLCMGLLWTANQTLFSLEGMSYVVSIGSVITWLLLASFVWIKKRD